MMRLGVYLLGVMFIVLFVITGVKGIMKIWLSADIVNIGVLVYGIMAVVFWSINVITMKRMSLGEFLFGIVLIFLFPLSFLYSWLFEISQKLRVYRLY